jgi:Holliday junction resolvase-like predicted endonuclease
MDNEKKQISNLKNGIYVYKYSKKKKLYVLVTNQENETKKQTSRPSGERQARPPAWAMLDAPLKQVQTMRLKSLATGDPSENSSCFGTAVQPRRTPVNPAYLLNDDVSIATCNAHIYTTKSYIYERELLHIISCSSLVHLFWKFTIESIGPTLSSTDSMVDLPISCTKIDKRWAKYEIQTFLFVKIKVHSIERGKYRLTPLLTIMKYSRCTQITNHYTNQKKKLKNNSCRLAVISTSTNGTESRNRLEEGFSEGISPKNSSQMQVCHNVFERRGWKMAPFKGNMAYKSG